MIQLKSKNNACCFLRSCSFPDNFGSLQSEAHPLPFIPSRPSPSFLTQNVFFYYDSYKFLVYFYVIINFVSFFSIVAECLLCSSVSLNISGFVSFSVKLALTIRLHRHLTSLIITLRYYLTMSIFHIQTVVKLK